MGKVTDSLGFTMNRKRALIDLFEPKGIYLGDHFRQGKKIGEIYVPNTVMTAAKNNIWDVYFHDGTQIAAADWCMGLISSVGYSAIAAANTMSSHAGWTEYTAYTQTVRPAWGPGAASAGTVTNAAPVTFDFNATGTVKGIFIASEDTKSGTTGILFSAGLFSADVPVVADDQIKLTYAASQ